MTVSVLTADDARSTSLTKSQIYARAATGQLERVGRGVYADPATIDLTLLSLAGVTARQPCATMCLTSALVFHGLSDAIPFTTDIALPRGVRRPAGFEHVTWHSFDAATFDIGRTGFQMIGDVELFVYSPERSIIDCFRLAYREGSDQANLALRRWLREQRGIPSRLLEMARFFPSVAGRIRETLEVLL